MITESAAKKNFAYDASHPFALRWKTIHKHARKDIIGQIVGHWHPIHAKSPILHRYANFDGMRRVPVSHIVWTMHTGRPPKHKLWFVNGDPGDCRIENLTNKQPSAPPPSAEEVLRRKKTYINNARDKFLAANYGISIEAYDALHDSQGARCAICTEPESMLLRGKTATLAVDHCHTTKKVRGLLCANCNNGLGRFRDDPELLRKAVEYLEIHAHSSP